MRRFFRNSLWKIVSLAAALGLWVVLVGDPEVMTSISAPIHYKNLPRDLDIASEVPERVQIEIRGPSAKRSARRSSLRIGRCFLRFKPLRRV